MCVKCSYICIRCSANMYQKTQKMSVVYLVPRSRGKIVWRHLHIYCFMREKNQVFHTKFIIKWLLCKIYQYFSSRQKNNRSAHSSVWCIFIKVIKYYVIGLGDHRSWLLTTGRMCTYIYMLTFSFNKWARKTKVEKTK